MIKTKQGQNVIPAEATVTLPAKAYYEQVKLLTAMDESIRKYIEGIEVLPGTHSVQVKFNATTPLQTIVAMEVATQAAKDDAIMDRLVASGEHYYSGNGEWLTAYGHNDYADLIELNKKFAIAWEQAKQRAEAQVEAEPEELVEDDED